MKKSEIANALEALKEIKVSKIADKDLRNAIIEDHFVLLDAGRKTDAAVQDKRTIFLDAHETERNEVTKLAKKLDVTTDVDERKEIMEQMNRYADYLEAVNLFNEEVAKSYQEEVEGLKLIDRTKFVEAVGDDLKLSWIESLYPLFVLN